MSDITPIRQGFDCLRYNKLWMAISLNLMKYSIHDMNGKGCEVELGIWVEPDGSAHFGPIFWRVGP